MFTKETRIDSGQIKNGESMKSTFVLLLSACAMASQAQINLKGAVYTLGGEPIAGAVCKLQKNGSSRTTNEKGLYDFASTGTVDRSQRVLPYAIAAQGGRLSIRIDHEARVAVELHGLDGRLAGKVVNTRW
jgi:hypothetical protein